jgi:thioredoxin 1
MALSSNDSSMQGRQALEQLQQNSEQPILVKFVAPYCPSCETLAPVLEQLVTDYAGALQLVTIDMTEEPELAMTLAVRSAPTVILFKGVTVLETIAGLKPKKVYRDSLQKTIG